MYYIYRRYASLEHRNSNTRNSIDVTKFERGRDTNYYLRMTRTVYRVLLQLYLDSFNLLLSCCRLYVSESRCR